jgi:hypothetical protein
MPTIGDGVSTPTMAKTIGIAMGQQVQMLLLKLYDILL